MEVSIPPKCFLLKPLIREVDATCSLEERYPGVTQVSARLIYYPYFGFPVAIGSPRGSRPSPLSGLFCSEDTGVPERISIIVDLLEGQAAVTDITREQLEAFGPDPLPHLPFALTVPAREGFPPGKVLDARITMDDANKTALTFLTFIATKSRRLRRCASEVTLGAPVLILKPFWIMEIQSHPDNSKMLVDAVSGGYHPILT
ncbi:MAG TPA: hypothetical protein GX507_01875 [Clostridia bacterium]|nr:hypothetical protein [Clostridia bacterium]